MESGEADLSQATTFNLDEFVGIPAGHPGSFRSFMNAHLFSRVNLAAERIHFLDGAAADTDAECARYERAIAAAGGIDILILGLGTNGHIGFNEPAPALPARTHRVTLEPDTRAGNAELFGGDPAAVPPEALSMGIATILQARQVILVATGPGESDGCRTAGPWAGDAGTAGVVPAGSPRRRDHARYRRGGWPGSELIQRGWAAPGVVAVSPIAIRTESSAFFRRRSACASVTEVFCMTIAALTFHLARLSRASASS